MNLIKEQRDGAMVFNGGSPLKRAAWTVLLLLVLLLWATSSQTYGQQLRDLYRSVQSTVVMVKTEEIGLAPFPQQGLVSSGGLGSGVLISNDKVLTAAHLVQSADKTVVEFSQGEAIPARVIGCSFPADVALLQLERTPAKSVAAKLGDSDQVAVGDEIFVVGAPYGISNTLTAGHVSARRPLTSGQNAIELLQTDAAVNMGNSGSPVFNMRGEIVGIVTNIMSKSGGSEGLAFAATANTARHFLLEKETVWTGVEGFSVNDNLARAINLPQTTGVLVQRVAQGSIAARGGVLAGTLRANIEGQEIILGGDVILSVNGVKVDDAEGVDDIVGNVTRLKRGADIVIAVYRQGRIEKLTIPNSQ